ncbi:lipoyl(octanoyl) transferase LipB [Cellulomonas marina]|uniref:Octanoyltransferase n=1 Tax=Cellulomonas marina TaxID=988821 RepID=A0A1I0VZA2_9CELL|nr:lipoyl(octanoyl) transferase LipB [Cellulomonas marina]GIG27453.1 octanoyltransferase [Cellulomonas marina]SFA81614.1 lipoyl(octanoyl) transferase [Cellulomonas marina]
MDVLELDLGDRLAPYEPTWELQRRLHAEVADGSRPGTLVLCEHESVYTAGRRTSRRERPDDGTPVVDVDRGGRITWHGPGQLVGYPLVRLAEPVDVVRYVRALEEALIATCADLGLAAGRVEGRSGVWFPADAATGRPERKVAAIGVRVARATTMHGFALTCTSDLAAFGRIIPCGIEDAGVTSLSAEAGREVPVREVVPLVVGHLERVLAPLTAVGTSPVTAAVTAAATAAVTAAVTAATTAGPVAAR